LLRIGKKPTPEAGGDPTASPPWQSLLNDASHAAAQGRHHDALQNCDRAAMQGDQARYHAAVLRGDILLDLGDALGALSSYDSVADPSVPDATLDCARGVALFELVRFPEAENALISAVCGDSTLAHAHYVLGLIAEIMGTGHEVEHFRQARRLDPGLRTPHPQLSRIEFEKVIAQAAAALPEPVQQASDDIPIVISQLPLAGDLLSRNPPLSPTSGGMFVTPNEHRPTPPAGAPEPQPTMLLFKRNLERACSNREDLVDEIRNLVLHEVGHAMGLSDSELYELGLS